MGKEIKGLETEKSRQESELEEMYRLRERLDKENKLKDERIKELQSKVKKEVGKKTKDV